ncbi:hypothetical protein [Legionella sp. PC997]|uniref:hypothetical protein n=1 Tax=Legionella sp. PC997 TaxID=2755562 RepID=UPI0015F85917|nr:hypothetical protein [Legionella sp. PC997]QMT60868.1 hypothetical protein HBNCFIEN_02256 [Legionella sp. PC997]
MQAKLTSFFKKESIPKTSQEAFDILSCSTDLADMEQIVFHFKNLVDVEKSVLKSHALRDGRITNNQEFIADLEARLQKLQDAVNDEKPYKSLFGDVCKVKESLQVILGYYQDQQKARQRIVSNYLGSTKQKSNDVAILASSIATNNTTLLDEQDSKVLIKYSINFCAPTIMKEDIEKIGNIAQKSFLADHHQDPQFSYM